MHQSSRSRESQSVQLRRTILKATNSQLALNLRRAVSRGENCGPFISLAASMIRCRYFFFILCFGLIVSSTSSTKWGVFVHGCNTFRDHNEWMSIVWGDEQSGRSGRITAALSIIHHMSLHSDDLCVLWGSGIRSKIFSEEPDGNKMLEGDYTLDTLKRKTEELREVLARSSPGEGFSRIKCLSHLNTSQLEALMRLTIEQSSTQKVSINTVTEIEEALEWFRSRGCDRVIFVSSATHTPRCLRDASIVLERLCLAGSTYAPLILAHSAETCYAHSTADDVVILEPPHILPAHAPPVANGMIHDLHLAAWNRNRLVARLLSIPDAKRHDFNNLLKELVDQFLSEEECVGSK